MIIDLTYIDQENNEHHYKNNDWLFLNITDPKCYSKYVTKIFKNYVGKHMIITSIEISFITDYYSYSFKTINGRILLATQMAHSVKEQSQYMNNLNFKLLSK